MLKASQFEKLIILLEKTELAAKNNPILLKRT